MKNVNGLDDDDWLKKPFSFDVWFSPKLKATAVLMEDIDDGDIDVKSNDPVDDGLSRSERQWLQISL